MDSSSLVWTTLYHRKQPLEKARLPLAYYVFLFFQIYMYLDNAIYLV